MESCDLPNVSNHRAPATNEQEALEIMHEQLMRAIRRHICKWPAPKDRVDAIIEICMRTAGIEYKMQCSKICAARDHHDDDCTIAYNVKGAQQRKVRMLDLPPKQMTQTNLKT